MALTPPVAGQVWEVDPSGIGRWTDPNADPRTQLYNYLGQTAGGSSASNPALQQLLAQGYLSVGAGGGGEGGGGGASYELGPNAPANLSTMFRPQGISGADKAIDPRYVVNDPTYGSVTDTRNIYHTGEHDFMAKYGQPIMEMLFSLGMPMAIGAVGGAGAGLGSLGNSIFKGLGNEILGGGQNPLASLQSLFSKGGGGATSAVSPIMSIISLLSRLKGGTTPS